MASRQRRAKLTQPYTWRWYRSLWILLLTAISRELTLFSLAPVYGSANAHGSQGLSLDIGVLLSTFALLHVFSNTRVFVLPRVISIIPMLGCSIPSILSSLFQLSGALGPRWGPFVSFVFTTLPLTFLSSLNAAYSVSQQKAYGKASSPPRKTVLIIYAVAYVSVLVFQMIAHQLLQELARPTLVKLGRYGMQTVLTGLFAALDCSRSLLFTVPMVCFSVFSIHLPLQSNIGRLNASLKAQGFAIVDRQESITGYLSVLDNFRDGYRVLRCDHSLLGGEWTRYPPQYTSKPREPIYAVFVMLEAVRLVETKSSKSQTQKHDSEKQALTM